VFLWILEEDAIISNGVGNPHEHGGAQMPTLTIEYRDESHRIALEQAIAYVSQLRQAAHDAPSGTVLEACEKLALSDGRASLRSTLAAALEGRIALSEQRGGPHAPAPRRTPGAPRAGTSARS
jgi:hypothetical protein